MAPASPEVPWARATSITVVVTTVVGVGGEVKRRASGIVTAIVVTALAEAKLSAGSGAWVAPMVQVPNPRKLSAPLLEPTVQSEGVLELYVMAPASPGSPRARTASEVVVVCALVGGEMKATTSGATTV